MAASNNMQVFVIIIGAGTVPILLPKTATAIYIKAFLNGVFPGVAEEEFIIMSDGEKVDDNVACTAYVNGSPACIYASIQRMQ